MVNRREEIVNQIAGYRRAIEAEEYKDRGFDVGAVVRTHDAIRRLTRELAALDSGSVAA